MPGPPKKPTKLKLLEGNPGKQKLNKHEPEPRQIMPDAPAHLCDDAKNEWTRICQGLHHMGLLTEVDRNALGAYCSSYALWAQSWRVINEMASTGKLGAGLMIKTTNGNMIQNPLVGTANVAARDMVRYAAEFGLTPAARARIDVGPKHDDRAGQELRDLMRGRKR